jgi:hypothetical protein
MAKANRESIFMKKLKKSYIVVLALIFCIFTVSSVQAENERIAKLTVTIATNNELHVSAELIRWIDEQLVEDIQNGIPKDLFYTLILKKRIPVWYDDEISVKTIKHTIKYDILKKQYLITTLEDGETTQQIAETLQEMMDLISKINNVKMILPKTLRKRHTYYMSVKAEMKASRLPFYLDYILFFIPALELDTPWADSAPFYALEKSP